MKPKNRLLNVLFFLIGPIASGAIGYHFIEGWTWFESLYMTAITLSTIGYSEVHPLSDWGRFFTLFLIISGVGSFAYIMGQIVQFTLDLKFNQIYRRKKMSEKIAKLGHHTIICGFGKMGRTMAEEIQKKGRPFVIIEKEKSYEPQLQEANIPYIIGDASDNKNLLFAGIEKAKSLVSVVTTDAENVFITLTARSLNKELFIISRVFDEATTPKLIVAGANKVVSPYTQAAFKMAQTILNPAVDDFIEILHDDKNLEFQMADFLVEKDMTCAGKSLNEIKLKEKGVMIISIQKKEGKIIFAPHKSQILETGDRLMAIGSGNKLESQLQNLLSKEVSTKVP